jgi:GNAT superfamily N-acetyltransferase
MLLRYQTGVVVPSPHIGVDDCVTEIRGKIWIYLEDTDEDVEAGEITVQYLDVWRAKAAGLSIWDLFDATSHIGNATYQAVWDAEAQGYKPGITDALSGYNLLIIHTMQIKPEFRGHNLGLAAVDTTINRFGHDCALIIVKPYPINAYDLTGDQIEQGVKSLSAYYARLGFVKVPDSDLMALDLDLVRPTAYEAGYKDYI